MCPLDSADAASGGPPHALPAVTTLVDFGRALIANDGKHTGYDVAVNPGVETFRCPAMLELEPWAYDVRVHHCSPLLLQRREAVVNEVSGCGRVIHWQADLFAVAATLHCLLFGEYMRVNRAVDGVEYMPSKKLKRYVCAVVVAEQPLVRWSSR